MDRRAFLAFAGSTAVLPQIAVAQKNPPRTVKIGWLTAQQEASLTPYLAAMRQGFSELGYVEGQNLLINYRFGNDQLDRVPELAAELVKSGVELIVAQGAAVSQIEKQSLPIPIVYIFSGDPTAAGFADSLSRPRGNMTGVTLMAAELNSKRLESCAISFQDCAVSPSSPTRNIMASISSVLIPRKLASASASKSATIRTPSLAQLGAALSSIKDDPVQAVSIFSDGFAVQNRKVIFEHATELRIPVIAAWSVFARSGAICSFGPLQSEQYRRLAAYVDRITKGAKPSELPIQQPSKFETIVNLRTAKALGLSIPPTLLASADEIIE